MEDRRTVSFLLQSAAVAGHGACTIHRPVSCGATVWACMQALDASPCVARCCIAHRQAGWANAVGCSNRANFLWGPSPVFSDLWHCLLPVYL